LTCKQCATKKHHHDFFDHMLATLTVLDFIGLIIRKLNFQLHASKFNVDSNRIIPDTIALKLYDRQG